MIEVKALPIFPKSGTISLSLSESECIALIGSSGSGKSSLLNFLGGKIRPPSGEVLINGKPAYKNKTEICRYPLQNNYSDHLSVYEVVLAGRKSFRKAFSPYSPLDRQITESLITQFSLSKYSLQSIEDLPQSLRHKTMIAHAFARSKPFLTLDNPDVFLDIASKRELSHSLRKYASTGKNTVIFATQDISFALQTADRVIILKDNNVFADGKVDIVTEEIIRACFNVEIILSKNIFNGKPEISVIPIS